MGARYWIRRLLIGSGPVEQIEEMLRRTPPGDPAFEAVNNDLAAALAREFELRGKRGALDRSLRICAEMLTRPAAHPGSALRVALLTNQGIALRLRGIADLNDADIAAAVEALCEALRSVPAGDDRARAIVLHALGTAVCKQAEDCGDALGLETAIDCLAQVVELTGLEESTRFNRLASLGSAYAVHFRKTGQLASRDRGIAVLEEALRLGRQGPYFLGSAANNLGELLRVRFEASGEAADGERSVELARMAVSVSDAGDPYQPGRFINLGLACEARATRGGSGDLPAALAAYRQAVHLLAARSSHPWHAEAVAGAARVRTAIEEITVR